MEIKIFKASDLSVSKNNKMNSSPPYRARISLDLFVCPIISANFFKTKSPAS